jgi:RHS repeat-associated protein
MYSAKNRRLARKIRLTAAIAATLTVLAGSGPWAQPSTSLDPNAPPLPGRNAPPLPGRMVLPATPIAVGASVGYLPGSWDVSPAGQFTYSIPLDVPAGRAGMQPTLSLVYSSGAGNGLLGVGWSLSGLSSITRCRKTLASDGVVDGVDYGTFAATPADPKSTPDKLCLDGNKLVAIQGADGADDTEYRTEHDAFAQIVSRTTDPALGPDNFVVRTKGGLTRTYTSASAPHFVPIPVWKSKNLSDPSSTVYERWLLTSEVDRSGNSIAYSYTTILKTDKLGDSVQFVPSRIDYTKHTSDATSHRYIQFDYEDLPDMEFAWQSGVRTALHKRLKAITMHAPFPSSSTTNSVAAWKYFLEYETSRFSNRSMISAVQKCGMKGEAQGACTWKKKFAWIEAPATPSFMTLPFDTANVIVDPHSGAAQLPALHLADMDGDGTDDVLFQPGAMTVDQDTHSWLYTSRETPPFGPVKTLGYKFGALWGETDLARHYPIDLDGDGKSELFGSFNQDSTTCDDGIVRWNGSGFSQVMTFPTYPCNQPLRLSHFFLDFDGDGRLDHMQVQRDGPVCTYCCRSVSDQEKIGVWQIEMNIGGPFGPPSNTTLLAYPGKTFAVDFDGDGRGEVYGWELSSGDNGPTVTSRLSDISGWIKAILLDDPLYIKNLKEFTFADFNGDGLQDKLDLSDCSGRYCGSRLASRLWWNTGDGFTDAGIVLNELREGDLVKVADMNRDGRADLVVLRAPPVNKITVILSNGDGTFSTFDLPGGAGLWVDPPDYPAFGNKADPFPTTKIGDVNGDGFPDIVRVNPGPNGQNSTLEAVINVGQWSDRLLSVTDEGTLWPEQTIVYDTKWTDKPEPDLISGNVYPKHRIRRGLVVVREVKLRDHVVDPATTNPAPRSLYYSYEGPLKDMRGRGFLGFSKLRIWDPARPMEKTVHFVNHVQWPEWPTPAYPYALRPTRVRTVTALTPPADGERRSGTETIDARVTQVGYTNQVKMLNGGKTYVDLPSTWTSFEWEQKINIDWGAIDAAPSNPTSDHIFGIDENLAVILRKRSGSDQFDDFGNRTDHFETTASGASQHVVSVYDNLVDNWQIGLLRQETTTAQEANQLPLARTMDYDYDSLGRLTVVHREKNNVDTRTRRTTVYTLDDYGLPTKAVTTASDPTAPPPRVTHIEYEPWWPGQPNERVYPSQFWEEFTPLPHRPTQWVAHHPAYGVVMASMDSNGITNVANYDDLGRPLNIYPAGSASIGFTYAGRPDLVGGTNGTVVTTTTQDGSQSKRTRDALGRVIASSHPGFDGFWIDVDTKYDVLGRMVSQSRPHYPAVPPTKATTYTYDPLGRLTQELLPDSTKIKHQHTFFTHTRWDGDNNQSLTERDINGRIVKTVNMWKNGWKTTPVTTRFDYEAFGLPHVITTDKGNKTTYTHDAIGRTVLSDQPDGGTVQYVYNGFDAVISKLHLGSNASTTFVYDALGRSKGSVGPEGTTTLDWDSQPNGVGRLASGSSPDGVDIAFNYDSSGRSTGFVEKIDGASYTIGIVYDAQGRVHQLDYPSIDGKAAPGLTLTYQYNLSNYLQEIDYSATGVISHVLWKATSRNLDGALLQGQIGASLDVIRSYDPNLGRLSKTQYKSGNNAVFDLDYTYWFNGLVRTRNDNVAQRQETFTYDTVGRLWKWDATHNAVTRNIQYDCDPEGNLLDVQLNHLPVETNTYGPTDDAGPHAISQQTVSGVTTPIGYDAHGRQTTKGVIRDVKQYSDFDLPKLVVSGDDTWSLIYDAFGRRVKKSGPNSESTYIAGLYERRIDNGVTSHIFHTGGPEGAIADFSRADPSSPLVPTYTLTDPLGSVGALADNAGFVAGTARRYFEPFGKRINADGSAFSGSVGPVQDGFAGQEHDDKLGLINMRGRMYDPDLKRMMSADPRVTLPLYGQSWNRYSYVFNSPLNFRDPTGFDGEGAGAPDPGPPPYVSEDTHTYGPGPISGVRGFSGCMNDCFEPASPPPPPAPPSPASFVSAVPQSGPDTYAEPAICYEGPTVFALNDGESKAGSLSHAVLSYNPEPMSYRVPEPKLPAATELQVLMAGMPSPATGPLQTARAIASAYAANGLNVFSTTSALLTRFGERIGVMTSSPRLLTVGTEVAEEVAASKALFDSNTAQFASRLVSSRFQALAQVSEPLARLVYGRSLELFVDKATTLGRQGIYQGGAYQPDWLIPLLGRTTKVELTTFEQAAIHLQRAYYATGPYIFFLYEGR